MWILDQVDMETLADAADEAGTADFRKQRVIERRTVEG